MYQKFGPFSAKFNRIYSLIARHQGIANDPTSRGGIGEGVNLGGV